MDDQREDAELKALQRGDEPALYRLALATSLAACAYFLFHCLFVIFGPEMRLMSWLYDDALYYAIVAKHFRVEHLSSFDGTTLTSGYHPLWMWLCSFVYGWRDRLDLTYLRCCMGLTALIASTLLFAAMRSAIRRRDVGWLWALAVGATSYSAFNNGLTIMEWPLVVSAWAMLHVLLRRSVQAEGKASITGAQWVAAFALGVFGSLSRTDFGLIPFVYVVGGAIVAFRYGARQPIRLAGTALVGSVAGLAITFLYNHAMTGLWLQQSAQVKHVFAQLSSPFNPVPALWQFTRVLVFLPSLDLEAEQRARILRIGAPLVLLVAAAALVWAYRSRTRIVEYFRASCGVTGPVDEFELTSAALGVVCYLGVYSLNSQATYGWYTATVTGFVLILAARIFSLLPKQPLWGLLLLALNVLGSTHGGTSRTQYEENEAGQVMHRDHPGAIMGGGDVGKPSFYNNGTMLNIDGLMNNEVVPYLIAGKLPCYLLKRQIAYLSDIGTISVPLTIAVRKKTHQPPLPWWKFFLPVEATAPDGRQVEYFRTDFEAIRKSGECPE